MQSWWELAGEAAGKPIFIFPHSFKFLSTLENVGKYNSNTIQNTVASAEKVSTVANLPTSPSLTEILRKTGSEVATLKPKPLGMFGKITIYSFPQALSFDC